MKRLLWLLVFIPTSLFAQYHVQDVVLVNQGGIARPRPGTITVCASTATGTPCTPTTNIYSDIGLTMTKSNPFNADTNGNYDFYVPAGTYLVTITGLGSTGQSYTVTAPCTIASINCGGGSAVTPASMGAVGPVCNVMGTSCLGATTTPAVADWRTVSDVTALNSANTWSSPTINVTSADVGKKFTARASGGTGTVCADAAGKQQFTVATVTSTTAWTSTVNTAGGGCNGSNLVVGMGTDNSAAFNSTELAIHNSTNNSGVMFFPPGEYGVYALVFNQGGSGDAISYWGSGSNYQLNQQGPTRLHITPDLWVSSSSGIAFSANSQDWRDIVFTGDNINSKAGIANAAMFTEGKNSKFRDVQFVGFGASATTDVLFSETSDIFTATNLTVSMSGGAAVQAHSLGFNVTNPYWSGCPGFDMSDVANAYISGGVITGVGGGCGAVTSAGNSGPVVNVVFSGNKFVTGGSAGTPIVNIAFQSTNQKFVSFVNPIFDNTGTSSQQLLAISSGASVKMSGASWRGSGTTPVLVTNAGTYYDLGGNFMDIGATGTYNNSGVEIASPYSYWPSPVITGTGACATIGSQLPASGAQMFQGTFACTGTSGAGTFTLTFQAHATNKWQCPTVLPKDVTTSADLFTFTSSTSTTCVYSAAALVQNDVIAWGPMSQY